MNNENSVKAELTEAFMHCVRANIVMRHGKFDTGKGEQSYEDLKKECYKTLLENNSAADLLKQIKSILSEMEITDLTSSRNRRCNTPQFLSHPYSKFWHKVD